MKTNEFIREVEALSFVFKVEDLHYNGEGYLNILCAPLTALATVSLYQEGVLNTRWNAFTSLSDRDRENLMHLLVEYTMTPINKRKEKTEAELAVEYIQDYMDVGASFTDCYRKLLADHTEHCMRRSKDTENGYLIVKHYVHQHKLDALVNIWVTLEDERAGE